MLELNSIHLFKSTLKTNANPIRLSITTLVQTEVVQEYWISLGILYTQSFNPEDEG